MPTVEGGVGTLDNGAMSQEAKSVLTSLAAALSEGVAAGGTVDEAVADDGSKTLTQTRETTVGNQAITTATVILQPSTAEGVTDGATAQLAGAPDADADFSATVPAGVVVAASGPDAIVDGASAGTIVTQTIKDPEVLAITTAAAEGARDLNVVVKTVTPVPQELSSGQVEVSAPARDESDTDGATRVVVIDTSSVRSNPSVELGLRNIEFVVLDGALSADGGLTADESAYGGAIRVNEGSSEIIATSQADILYGGSTGSDRLMANSGDDVVYAGSGGNSYIAGGAGADHLVGSLSGSAGNTIDGGLGNDVLVSSGAKTTATDTFLTDAADVVATVEQQRQFEGLRDLVNAEASDTTLSVGDTFVFGNGSGYDYVFNYHAGVDAIQVAANVNGTGISTAADALERATAVGGDTLIDLGDGNAIHLSGVSLLSLTADDIVIG